MSMENPYEAIVPEDRRAEYDREATLRLFARRSLAWSIDLVVCVCVLVSATILVEAIDASVSNSWLEMSSLALCTYSFICGFLVTTPGLKITGLKIQGRSSKIGRQLRASRFLGLPFCFMSVLVYGAWEALEGPYPKSIWSIAQVAIFGFYFCGTAMTILGPLLCLSPSGRSPLDRIFGTRIVRRTSGDD